LRLNCFNKKCYFLICKTNIISLTNKFKFYKFCSLVYSAKSGDFAERGDIHDSCIAYGKEEDGYCNYVKGENIAGFVKVADAMLAQGVI
jgi:hypothetical protein